MRNNHFLVLLLLFLLSSAAQADTVITKDGEQYYGKVLSQDSKKVVLELKIGIMKFPREEVASIEFSPPTVTSSTISDEAVSAPTEKPLPIEGLRQPQPTAQKPVRQIIPWKPSQRTPEQEEMLKREAETYKKLDEMQKAKELKKKLQEELQKKQLEEEKKKASESKTSAVKPTETPSEKKIEVKKEEKKEVTSPSQPTEIKPTIRGLDTDRYKTY